MNPNMLWWLLPIGQADTTAAAATAEVGGIPFLVWWLLAPVGAMCALAAAFVFYRQMLAASPGDERMREIAGYVREGAFAYLKRQYVVVALAFVFLVILLALQSFVLKQQHGLVPFAFLTGGFFSGLSGFIGMNTATLASNRTTQGAKESLNRGLQVAFRAGAVMGLTVVGLGLIDISIWFALLAYVLPATIDGFHMTIEQITVVMLTFGMGASTQALFARVGGGIFTKAADVGADLVGKVEAGIPEDDPRNPATIADNVGDNVGDVAGMGADLYESYCGSILATAALGAAAALGMNLGLGGDLAGTQLRLVVAPMILAGVGILLSIASIFLVKTEEGASQMNLLWALRRGIYGASLGIAVAALGVCWLVLPEAIWFGVFCAIFIGLLVGVLIGYFTEYYTAAEFPPTKWIAEQSITGPATTIIAGVAQGMLSTWASIAIVGIGTIVAYFVAGGAGQSGAGALRRRLRGRRHAGDARDHPGDRRLRADRRQRRRQRRDDPPAARGPRADRRARLARQHDGRHRQGLRHRLGGPDGAGPAGGLRRGGPHRPPARGPGLRRDPPEPPAGRADTGRLDRLRQVRREDRRRPTRAASTRPTSGPAAAWPTPSSPTAGSSGRATSRSSPTPGARRPPPRSSTWSGSRTRSSPTSWSSTTST